MYRANGYNSNLRVCSINYWLCSDDVSKQWAITQQEIKLMAMQMHGRKEKEIKAEENQLFNIQV